MLAKRLADRKQGRTEANVQSDLHLLLAVAPLNLDDDQIRDDIVLEAQAGDRRRIDVEIGATVFEVKRDLRVGHVREEAVKQLAGYVRARREQTQQRYVGVLTDGAEWRLYHLVDNELHEVSVLHVDPVKPDVDGLLVWLEGVLATGDRIVPLPREITRRLGAGSPSHALDRAELKALYAAHQTDPTVRLKRRLWAKLLTTALGTAFTDEDDLFVEHTLLVVSAELIAHAVVGIDPADANVASTALLAGQLFAQAQIGGVVESDFFDWVVEIEGGDAFVRGLARRLTRFAWDLVEHDVMKVLYESVINAPTRHALGEYYTPDWLAEEVVLATVSDPLRQRTLDPACGSGTFVFHAVRHFMQAAEAVGMSTAEAIRAVTGKVAGVDVHPVAVTLARVTYLLAIGVDRLAADDRPAFSVPVYLGDSVQWGQDNDLLSHNALRVATDEDEWYSQELIFPERLLNDAGRFDQLVAELAEKASARTPGAPIPSLTATLRRYAVHPDDQDQLVSTFHTMCTLSDQGRDHIWGYYVRNLARPLWLAREANRVDVLVGNPPWLAYRYMTETMQAQFRSMSQERALWAGVTVATHQDLSGLFLARTVELYLRAGGRFGYVMPLAALSRKQFAGLRQGAFDTAAERVTVRFAQPWDLHAVKPTFFPVPACVIFGQRTHGQAAPLDQTPESWSGRLPATNARREATIGHLFRVTQDPELHAEEAASPYAARFGQGATLVPRLLFAVEPAQAPPLGAGAGRKVVTSRRSNLEKPPWKSLPSLTGAVEAQFIRPMHLGDTVMSYRCLEPLLTVVPWDGKQLLHGAHERLDLYPGLAAWWREAEKIWNQYRSSDRLSLVQQLDYRRKLQQQFPAAPHRVLYAASGMYLAAARLDDPSAVVDKALYWAAAESEREANYLVAVLNSTHLMTLIRPLLSRGEHNPRHIDKYIFRAAIPQFEPTDALHGQLADLGAAAEAQVAGMDLTTDKVRFEAFRRRVREAVADSEVGRDIEAAVAELNLAVWSPIETTAALPAEAALTR